MTAELDELDLFKDVCIFASACDPRLKVGTLVAHHATNY